MTHSESSEEDPRFRIPRGESDEEIDSDLASISSSEIPSSSKVRKTTETNDGDDDESDTSGAMLLSDLFESGSTRKKISETAEKLSRGRKTKTYGDESLLPEDSGSESEENADDEALANITLAATGRRDVSREKLRAARKVIPGIGKESLHGVPTTSGISQKEMMARMLDALKPEDSEEKPLVEGFSELQKKVRRLHSHGKKELAVPVPEPVQARVERSVAYDHAKKDVSEKWGGVVQKNRKAQRLEFPLNAPGRHIRATGDVAYGVVAKNEYEEEIEKILQQAGVTNEKEIIDREEREIEDDLKSDKISKEEILERRRQLAKMRSLTFHYEAKMKRIKKIKSKRYRRVMKKEREKLEKNNMGDDSDLEEEMIKAERRRAEERMSLRHKNTSKWVRRQLSRGEDKRNVETRQAIEEQLRMHEELKRKQEGISSDDSESDEEDLNEEEKNERLEEELVKIGEELIAGDKDMETKEKKKVKGIMGMGFMQAAQERKRQEALKLLKQMDADGEEEDDESDAEISGRRTFSGKTVDDNTKSTIDKNSQHRDEEIDDNNDDDEESKNLTKRIREEYENVTPRAASEKESTARKSAENGLYALNQKTKGNDRIATRTVGRISANTEVTTEQVVQNNPWLNANNTATKQQTGTENAVSNEMGDEPHQSTNHSEKKRKKKRTRNKKKGSTENNVSEPAIKKPALSVSKSSNTPTTTDTRSRMAAVAAAFADAGGGDLEQFEAEKAQEIEADVQATLHADGIQPSLPGWGNWDGAGVNPKQRRESSFARAARERLQAAKVNALSKRNDKDRAHVILNERRIKAASELMLSSVPFPYKSAQEWKMEVDTPVVKELMAKKGFENMIAKRVNKKAGSVILPITHGRAYEKKLEKEKGKLAVLQNRQNRARIRAQSRKGLLQ